VRLHRLQWQLLPAACCCALSAAAGVQAHTVGLLPPGNGKVLVNQADLCMLHVLHPQMQQLLLLLFLLQLLG
jgi:hypothetical protein